VTSSDSGPVVKELVEEDTTDRLSFARELAPHDIHVQRAHRALISREIRSWISRRSSSRNFRVSA
jgi:hypothetical protein